MENTIKMYLSQIQSIPIMDHDVLMDCFKELENCETNERKKKLIRDKIIASNLRLVISIAKQYKTSDDLPLEDLIQEGNIGLMKAVKKFKWEKGYKFSTYATWWIRQSISIHISKIRRTVRLPSHAIGVQRRIMKTIEEYNDKTGQTPTIDELKKTLSDVSETILEATLHAGMGTVSINATRCSNCSDQVTNNSLENKLFDESLDPFELFSQTELFNIISSVMDELTFRESAVIRMRFGLYDSGLNRDDYIEDGID